MKVNNKISLNKLLLTGNGYVYRILNKKTKRAYIGSTTQPVVVRIQNHLSDRQKPWLKKDAKHCEVEILYTMKVRNPNDRLTLYNKEIAFIGGSKIKLYNRAHNWDNR